MNFTEKEKERYRHHFALDEIGEKGQERLRKSRILVVGAGGLGCPALQYLTAAGIGQITVIDPDVIELSNLQRQIIYRESDTGKYKALCAAGHLKQLNADVTVTPICERLTVGNIRNVIAGHDLVIDGTDNLTTRYLINDACVIAGIPFIIGALHKFSGQVSVFNYPVNEGGSVSTYRSVFRDPPVTSPDKCLDAGIIGPIAGIIGTIQATEAIKILSKSGRVLAGKMLILNGLNMDFSTWNLPVDQQGSQDAPQTWDEIQRYDYEHFVNDSKLQSSLDAIEFDKLHNSNLPIQLLDVREQWEVEQDPFEAAIRIPLAEVPANLEAFNPILKTIVVCSNGVRSMTAVKYLIDRGFTDVKSLEGGIKSWKNIHSQMIK